MTGSPWAGILGKNKDLPGYWAVLFVRATVKHPVGYDPPK